VDLVEAARQHNVLVKPIPLDLMQNQGSIRNFSWQLPLLDRLNQLHWKIRSLSVQSQLSPEHPVVQEYQELANRAFRPADLSARQAVQQHIVDQVQERRLSQAPGPSTPFIVAVRSSILPDGVEGLARTLNVARIRAQILRLTS
jgi:hypothetical protein